MISIPGVVLAVVLGALITLVGVAWKYTVGVLQSDVKLMKDRWTNVEQIVCDTRHDVHTRIMSSRGGDEALCVIQRSLSRARSEVWPEGRLRRRPSVE
jgi:hypothetical protein